MQSAYGGSDVSADADPKTKKKNKKPLATGAIDDPECMIFNFNYTISNKLVFVSFV